MKALIVMNHQLNETQKKDLKNNWNINHFEEMSMITKSIWGNIPPELDKDDLKNHLIPITNKIKGFRFIILAGELTACLIVINAAKRQKIKILTATSRRENVITISPNGETIKRSIFKHVRFREL